MRKQKGITLIEMLAIIIVTILLFLGAGQGYSMVNEKFNQREALEIMINLKQGISNVVKERNLTPQSMTIFLLRDLTTNHYFLKEQNKRNKDGFILSPFSKGNDVIEIDAYQNNFMLSIASKSYNLSKSTCSFLTNKILATDSKSIILVKSKTGDTATITSEDSVNEISKACQEQNALSYVFR